jgi:hypothetical protein
MKRALLIALVSLAATAPAASAGPLVIQGTDGPDRIRVEALTPLSGTYTVNGVQTPFALATSVRIEARGGSDDVVIVNPPVGLFAPPGGIRVSGGDDLDYFTNQGGTSLAGTLDHGVDGAGTNTLTHLLGPVTQKVVFDGFEYPRDELTADRFTYRATSGSDDLRLSVEEYQGPNNAVFVAGDERFSTRGKATLAVDSKASGATPDRVELEGWEVQSGRVIVDDGSSVPEDDVVLAAGWGGMFGGQADLEIRAGTLTWDGNNDEDFRGRSLAIEAGQMVPDATSFDGRFEVDADQVEIHTDGDVRVYSDGQLNVGGASTALSGVRSSGGAVHLETFHSPIVVPAGEQVAGEDVTLMSTDIDLLGDVSASGTATLRTRENSGRLFNLGAAATDPRDEPYTYALDAAELGRVSAGTIELGDDSVSFFWLTAPVSVAGSTPLRLVSEYVFGGFNGAAIDAAELELVSHDPRPNDWAIGPTSVSTPSGGGPILYTRATRVSARAGSGADDISVTPSPTTAFTIDGGGPTTSPGDVLTYVSGGRTVAGDSTPPSGSLTADGVQPVVFDAIEDLSILP